MNRGKIQARLRKLPRRAVAAFAARCARRVEPLCAGLELRHREAVRQAIEVAERFAAGDNDDPGPGAASAAYSAAADAADAAAAYAAAAADAAAAAYAAALYAAESAAAFATSYATALYAAAAAADAATDSYAAAADAAAAAASYAAAAAESADVVAAATADLARIGQLYSKSRIREQGRPVDPSEHGPLGTLWPHGEPGWYTEAMRACEAAGQLDEPPPDAAPLSLYFDLSEFTAPDIAEMIGLLSELYGEVGGDRLVIEGMTLLDPAELPVPEGV